MIKIAISVAAFEAIARTLPLGSVGYESNANERGERLVWLESAMVNRLSALRGPGESLSAEASRERRCSQAFVKLNRRALPQRTATAPSTFVDCQSRLK
jgi:hypothetical protein